MIESDVWREGIYAFLGLENGVPVCCAGCRPVDGRLFVVLVAPEPTAYSCGFGEAVTRKALFEAGRVTVISYGKEHPVATGSDEGAWAQNRRAVTVVPE